MNDPIQRFLLTVLALLLPPVAVFAKKSGHHWQLYLNLFFCLAGYLPAIIHALWFVRRRPRRLMPEPEELDYDEPKRTGNGRPSRVEPRF